MDIYEFAEKYNYGADYLDLHTGYIYKCTEYSEELGIPVYSDGELIGYAKRKEESQGFPSSLFLFTIDEIQL